MRVHSGFRDRRAITMCKYSIPVVESDISSLFTEPFSHFETDTSSTHKNLNSQFIIGDLQFVEPTVAQVNYYTLRGNSSSAT